MCLILTGVAFYDGPDVSLAKASELFRAVESLEQRLLTAQNKEKETMKLVAAERYAAEWEDYVARCSEEGFDVELPEEKPETKDASTQVSSAELVEYGKSFGVSHLDYPSLSNADEPILRVSERNPLVLVGGRDMRSCTANKSTQTARSGSGSLTREETSECDSDEEYLSFGRKRPSDRRLQSQGGTSGMLRGGIKGAMDSLLQYPSVGHDDEPDNTSTPTAGNVLPRRKKGLLHRIASHDQTDTSVTVETAVPAREQSNDGAPMAGDVQELQMDPLLEYPSQQLREVISQSSNLHEAATLRQNKSVHFVNDVDEYVEHETEQVGATNGSAKERTHDLETESRKALTSASQVEQYVTENKVHEEEGRARAAHAQRILEHEKRSQKELGKQEQQQQRGAGRKKKFSVSLRTKGLQRVRRLEYERTAAALASLQDEVEDILQQRRRLLQNIENVLRTHKIRNQTKSRQ